MRILSIDLETYSSVDLAKCGVYAYTQAKDFEILLLAYAFDDEPVEVIDLVSGEEIPDKAINALTNPNIIKSAFNANFERTCLAKHLNKPMPQEQWRCSQAHSLTLGLPASLKEVARCLKLSQQKMDEGKALIRYFSMPCRPTKANGGRTRNLPCHDRGKWETFKTYCKQDVVVERSIRKRLENYPMTDKELKLWYLDQKINDFGVKVDTTLVKNAIQCDEIYQKELMNEATELTGLENPNSPTQLKGWLKDNYNLEVESLSKTKVAELLDKVNNPIVKRVLELRQEMSKTSVRKYEAMDRAMGKDERIRGLLQFYGASTGRWAGRLVQVHNLPRNNMSDLDLARQILLSGDYETLELLFDSVPDVLSQLVRTAFIPSKGHRFIVSDFSAIEARVIAWLAGEKWVIDTFKDHGKIYEMTASRMFGVPMELIVKGNPEYELRQKGKVAVLACGYQGSVGALKAMGALNMGLKEDELPAIVAAWRESNPNIVKLWWDVEDAAIRAVKDRTSITMQYGLKFYYKSGVLFIRLPSGRNLAYVKPRIELDTRFNKDKLTYEGIMLGNKWARIDTYGGKLTENIIQAIARDCLAESLLRLDKAGYKIAFHVHDEVVLDVPQGFGSLKEVEEIMSQDIN
jgi:DNA polymerase